MVTEDMSALGINSISANLLNPLTEPLAPLVGGPESEFVPALEVPPDVSEQWSVLVLASSPCTCSSTASRECSDIRSESSAPGSTHRTRWKDRCGRSCKCVGAEVPATGKGEKGRKEEKKEASNSGAVAEELGSVDLQRY